MYFAHIKRRCYSTNSVGTQQAHKNIAIAQTKKELALVMNKIHNTIRVTSIKEENLLLDKFDIEEFYNDI